MRIGIIGIGNICKKAYLPVLTSRKDIELVLCTRNESVLEDIKEKYRIKEGFTTVDELINSKIKCAFVHSSTESHFEICKKLLINKIHVYVDKPISYSYKESEELYKIAKENSTKIMIGFNRRFAPKVSELKKVGNPDIIIIEKNRVNLPNDIRTFIFDDFIHVVDTLRFLMDGEYENFTVDYKCTEEGLLKNIVLKLSNKNTTAIGIMNRDNGVSEETIEYMSSGKKYVVKSLVQTTKYENNKIAVEDFGDWIRTLYKRGFETIIDEFIKVVKEESKENLTIEDSLKTHKLCENIIFEIQENNILEKI